MPATARPHPVATLAAAVLAGCGALTAQDASSTPSAASTNRTTTLRDGWLHSVPPNTPGAVQEPAPSVHSSVDLKVWGRAFFVMSYDNFQGRGGIGGLDWMNYVTAEGMDQVNFNPRDTRFGFSASETFGEWTARAVGELDFYGSNNGNNFVPRLRLGYVEAMDEDGLSIRAGQDWIPVAQQNPGTIDFGILAWGGNLWWRVPQLTIRKATGDWEVLGSVMHHRVSNSQEQQERMPWVLGRAAWSGPVGTRTSTFALGGGFRSATVDDVDYDSWLVAFEFNVPLGNIVRLKGEAWTGQGIGREWLRYDLDYNTAVGTELAGSGGFASAEIAVSEQTRINLGWGTDRPTQGDLAGSAAPFRNNNVYFVNTKYQMSKHLGTGLEVMHARTDQIGGPTLRGTRVNLAFWYIF